MAKIDVYLRSIERFGATGAILWSGQAVTLRFPQGDRHATQVTPHDQLVGLVREVAPPAALDQIDKNRPAKFDVDSNGTRYTLTVAPKPGAWQVTIETAAAAAAAAPAAPPSPGVQPVTQAIPRQPRAPTAPTIAETDEMAIERGQYTEAAPRTTSGSGLLDQLTAAARQARATDLYLATGAAPAIRAGNGELQAIDGRGALDAETISRELGIVAPADARSAWTENGVATFTYGDGVGRVRATLTRDHRGPAATLRLLVGEPPALDRLGIGREVAAWLDQKGGLVLVAGPSGSGKTTTLAALVRALGEKRRRVVMFEKPIEIIHVTTPWVSQRAVGEHVPTIGAGVAAAMREAADAIVIGLIASPESAGAAVEAVAAGHLVLATIAASNARHAVDQLVDLLPYDRRDLARSALGDGLLGTIAPVVKGGGRSFEVVAGRGG
ncbi:MAG: Flp pilus assembly complex ATPase component TadA [Kofleriaceae bacterium]|nr:Flp pilus assembly complex ATPase component TadA [Kofleriaceae bacterium]